MAGLKGIFHKKRNGIMIIVKSVHGVPVRVTHERIEHICGRHPEMQGHDELYYTGDRGTGFCAGWRFWDQDGSEESPR